MAIDIKVNFIKDGEASPSGFLSDHGFIYNQARSFGWVSGNSNGFHPTTTRTGAASLERRTFVSDVLAQSPMVWRINLPNGTYLVSVESGDPDNAVDSRRITCNGTTLVSGSTTADNYLTATDVSVSVTDNKLEVTVDQITTTGVLNWVRIKDSSVTLNTKIVGDALAAPNLLLYRQDRSFLEYIGDTVSAKHPSLGPYTPIDFDSSVVPNTQPSEASIDLDLDALKTGFDGILVYGVEPYVPYLIQRCIDKGFRAFMLTINDPKSREQIGEAVDLVKLHSQDIAMSICIGNEGLSLPDAINPFYTRYDLGKALTTIRQSLPASQRVVCTTSDLAELYQSLDNSAMHNFGDFLAPNLHPIHSKAGANVADSLTWLRDVSDFIMNAGEKILLVKETTWPHTNGGGLWTVIDNLAWTEANQASFYSQLRSSGIRVDSQIHTGIFKSFCSTFETTDHAWKVPSIGEFAGVLGIMSETRVGYTAFTDLVNR